MFAVGLKMDATTEVGTMIDGTMSEVGCKMVVLDSRMARIECERRVHEQLIGLVFKK